MRTVEVDATRVIYPVNAGELLDRHVVLAHHGIMHNIAPLAAHLACQRQERSSAPEARRREQDIPIFLVLQRILDLHQGRRESRQAKGRLVTAARTRTSAVRLLLHLLRLRRGLRLRLGRGPYAVKVSGAGVLVRGEARDGVAEAGARAEHGVRGVDDGEEQQQRDEAARGAAASDAGRGP